jgi:hypothetical protein
MRGCPGKIDLKTGDPDRAAYTQEICRVLLDMPA